jgi:hypothetical protein
MLRIEAPYPASRTTIILPSPSWGNSAILAATLKTLRTMTGLLYTYVGVKNKRKKCHWEFMLSRHKSLELKEFFSIYFGSKLRVIDHNATVWIGYFQSNPFEMSGDARAVDFPGGETMTITLDFEESE